MRLSAPSIWSGIPISRQCRKHSPPHPASPSQTYFETPSRSISPSQMAHYPVPFPAFAVPELPIINSEGNALELHDGGQQRVEGRTWKETMV